VKLSFRQAQRVGIGVLLGIIGAYSLTSVMALRATVADLRRYHSVLQFKAERFDQLAFLHMTFQAEFMRLDHSKPLEAPQSLRNHLDGMRKAAAELRNLSLTADEAECISMVESEERRLRTMLYSYVAAAGDSAADNPPQLRARIDRLVQRSVDRTATQSRQTSDSLRRAGADIDRSARRTLQVLVYGTVFAVLAGVGVTIFLTKALSGHVGRILTGTQQLAAGHLDYRINSPFRDAMGQLAAKVDRMADQIQQANASTEAILAHLPVGVVLIDESGRISHINKAALGMLGAESEAELVGRECHGTICELGCCSVLDPTEAVESCEAEILRRDGEHLDVLKSVIPLELDGKTVLLESFVDITQRKLAQEVRRESEARFKTLFEHAGDAILIHDRQGRLLDVNQEACIRLGYTPRELLHMTIGDIEAAESGDSIGDRLARVSGDSPLIYKTAHIRRDGRRVPVEVIARAFDFAGRPAVLSIARDITERKQVERQLQWAKEAAEANSRAKGDFLARMSHEIRTPINGVIGMAELALGADNTAEQAEYLQTVKESADSLLAIVNDLLDFSKIEAGKVELESTPFSLRECISSAVRSFGPRADEQDLELLFHVAADVPDAVTGDPGRIRQILVNLIGNAVKFTDAGQISVRVDVEEASQSFVVIDMAVQDTGIGIEPAKQKAIFEAFEQADGSTTRRYGGTGLGLAITADLTKLMGGKITVDSEPGQGATFHAHIRLQRQARVSERAAWLDRDDLADIPVLVVDDNPTGREFLLAALAQWKMRSMPATDGADALDKLRSAAEAGEPFGLVILDASLTDPNGFAVADAIAADPELDTAVVMMLRPTRWQDAGDRFDSGVIAGLLTKPVDPAHLSEAISRALGRPTPVQTADEPTEAEDPLTSLHVLLAEDNRVNQVLVQRLLARRGHRVTIADNGAVALDLWREHQPDVVITDLQMPGMTGFEITDTIRRTEADSGRHTPIIAMTAHALKDDRDTCLAAGMDAYVSKPVNPELLYRAVEQVAGTADVRCEARGAAIDTPILNG